MRNLTSLLLIFVFISSQAQIGIKAGLTYNADQGLFNSLDQAYQAKGDGSVGYHFGINKKFELTGLFIEPEILYVSYKNKFKDIHDKSFEIQHQRIDVPVSIGTNILGIANIKAGPVFSYYFQDKFNLEKVIEVEQKDLSMGLQVGGGIKLQNFTVDLRYDFPLGNRETKFIQNKQLKFKTEDTPKLLHLSLGYTF